MIVVDVIALMDALGIERAILGGCDWGARAAGADVVRSMAGRAGATITEVDGSHVIMVSQPQFVADVILTTVAAAPRKVE